MDGAAFLAVADDLLRGESEAEWRSAVSRAYYAAFHVARELLGVCGFRMPYSAQPHAYVSNRLRASAFPEVAEAGRELAELRSDRNWADYDLHKPLRQNRAARSVTGAAKVIDIFRLNAKELSVRDKITEAMKTYERDVLREVTWRP